MHCGCIEPVAESAPLSEPPSAACDATAAARPEAVSHIVPWAQLSTRSSTSDSHPHVPALYRTSNTVPLNVTAVATPPPAQVATGQWWQPSFASESNTPPEVWSAECTTGMVGVAALDEPPPPTAARYCAANVDDSVVGASVSGGSGSHNVTS